MIWYLLRVCEQERLCSPEYRSLRVYCSWRWRARELFYYLKGGQVDYGEDHNKTCGHNRFGRIYHTGRKFQRTQYMTMAFQKFIYPLVLTWLF